MPADRGAGPRSAPRPAKATAPRAKAMEASKASKASSRKANEERILAGLRRRNSMR